jgi:hypothetical protein
VKLGATEIKLLVAIAEIPEEALESLEAAAGVSFQPALHACDVSPVVRDLGFPEFPIVTVSPDVAQRQFEAMQRVSMAQQLVTLFLSSKVRCQVGTSSVEGEEWRASGGLELSPKEQQLYDACLDELKDCFVEGQGDVSP